MISTMILLVRNFDEAVHLIVLRLVCGCWTGPFFLRVPWLLDGGIQVGPADVRAVTDDGKLNPDKIPIAGIMRVMEREEK